MLLGLGNTEELGSEGMKRKETGKGKKTLKLQHSESVAHTKMWSSTN